MIRLCRNAFRHRTLLRELTATGIKARYRETLLGILWVVAQPIMLTALCAAGFFRVWGRNTAGSYPLFVYTGMVLWTLFAAAVSGGISSLTQNGHLIKKIYFPREILVLAAVAPPLVDFLISLSLLLGVLLVTGLTPRWSLLFLPLLLAAQLALVLGLSFAGALVDLVFHDLGKALPVLLAAVMFLSPVLYPYPAAGGLARTLQWANPFGGIVAGFRTVLLDQRAPDARTLWVPLLLSLAILLLGYRLFRYGESVMADIL